MQIVNYFATLLTVPAQNKIWSNRNILFEIKSNAERRTQTDIWFSREVTFRETAHTNYKHLEAMLLSPVATNSKLFS